MDPREYEFFLSAPEAFPSESLDQRVRSRINGLMNPSELLVFAKLGAIHLLVGGVTLFACPQLGVSPWGENVLGLMAVFMYLGTYGCFIGCGGLFLGVSALVASMVLRPEELRLVRRHRMGHIPALGLVSLGILMALGGESLPLQALLWLLGSVLSGIGILELGWKLRFQRA